MARIRYLKPDFFKDEHLAELPFESRLFFAGLWNFADKAGRLEDRPKRLKVEIFPYDKVDVEKCLDLLSKPKKGSTKPFIYRYEVDEENFIQILNWEKHQKPHHTEKDSVIPAPNIKRTKKRMGKGMGSVHTASVTLDNGSLTVKKHKHLEYVYLHEAEHQKLTAKLGKRLDHWIEKLNNYIGQIGVKAADKKYDSHYHVILNWSADERPSAVKNKKIITRKDIAESLKMGTKDEIKKLLKAIDESYWDQVYNYMVKRYPQGGAEEYQKAIKELREDLK